MGEPQYLCVVPARGGSKGIPGKNLRRCAGRPLIEWTIESARELGSACRVVVSTDSDEIASVALAAGAEVPFLRPAELATDEAATEPVLIHAVDELRSSGFEPDAVVLMQPTSPIRRRGALGRAVAQFEQTKVDSLVSVSEVHPFLWRNPAHPTALYDYGARPRRQDLAPGDLTYLETGSIYVTKREALLGSANRISGRIGLFVMSRDESIDIDNEGDFLVAEAILRSQFQLKETS